MTRIHPKQSASGFYLLDIPLIEKALRHILLKEDVLILNAPPPNGLSIVETTESRPLIDKVRAALDAAMMEQAKLSQEILSIEGMSGKKYRLLINNLIGLMDDARYLEIGAWKGSTLCSAIYGNSVRALAIDNWTEFGGPAGTFLTNLSLVKGPKAAVSFIESDFRAVDFSAIGKFNVYLFDGPHSAGDHRDAVLLARPALDDAFILIVDDWNWERVRQGTFDGIREAGLHLNFVAEIRTSLDDTHATVAGAASDWHNGYFIAVCSKPTPPG